MQEDITKVNFKKFGDSIYNINNVGCDIFILECHLLKGSNYNFENIPKIFYSSKVISVIKNKDEKCFIYCYIRKYLNNVDNHKDRISVKDKEIAKKLEEELNFNFDDVKIKDLNKIENLLETNIYVYNCNINLKNRLPVYKSDKNYEKFLDLLLFENHYMNIVNISRFFYPDEKNKIFFVEHAVTKCILRKKFDEHLQLCQINEPMMLMPSQNKYLQFKNLKNAIQHNFIVYADIESYMIHQDKNIYEHNHLMSGYYLHCIDEKCTKKVKLFDKLEDFRDNLIDELDYIKNINEKKLNFGIDMKKFNKEEFDKVKSCKHCNQKFEEDYNGRKITLIEKVDNYKLKRIIDDFGQNNINDETQQNLKKYENLNDDGEIKIIYKQNFNTGRYYSDKFSLQNMFNEVRSSIIHKDCTDIDFINSNITIIIYLAEKHKLKIPNIKKYSNDRENILKKLIMIDQ